MKIATACLGAAAILASLVLGSVLWSNTVEPWPSISIGSNEDGSLLLYAKYRERRIFIRNMSSGATDAMETPSKSISNPNLRGNCASGGHRRALPASHFYPRL